MHGMKGSPKLNVKRWGLGVLALALAGLFGCGSSVPVDPVVAITPGVITLQADIGQQQFTAAVNNAPDTGVVWQVNGVYGGNVVWGTITQKGMYTAPAIEPTSDPITVSAVSTANANSRANASVMITPPVQVTLAPASADVTIHHTVQFTATVLNAANTAVTWAVNQIAGGSAVFGTITPQGLYTAPATFPGLATVTVTATSMADPKQSASAQVLLANGVTVSISPTQASLNLNSSLQFQVTVTGTMNAGVNWSVNNVPGGNTALGTITDHGVYTAPATLPTPNTVTVTATSQADATASASATVTITAGTASFSLSPASSVLSLTKGTSGRVTLQLQASAGFPSPINLTATTGLPNVQASVTPAQMTASGTVTVNVTVSSISLAVTATPITITASATVSGQAQTATADVNLTVQGWKGIVSTLAGGPGGVGFEDGAGITDELQANAITSDGAGTLYFLDGAGYGVRSVSLASGTVSTLIGSPYTYPIADGEGAAWDASRQTVYIADAKLNQIRSFTLGGNATQLVAGGNHAGDADGVGTAALFDQPHQIALSPGGTTLYVADTGNDLIRTVNLNTGAVSTLAGQAGIAQSVDGVGTAAAFCQPWGVALDPTGADLYVSDRCSNQIREIALASDAVTTVAGSGSAGFSDGPARSATFSYLHGLQVDPDGALLYILDNNAVRALTLTGTSTVFTLAGQATPGYANGAGTQATFQGPRAVTVIANLNGANTTSLFIADTWNGLIRRLDLSNPLTATSSGNAAVTVSTIAGQTPNWGDNNGAGTGAGYSGTSTAQFYLPADVATDGKTAYVLDSSNNAIRTIDLATTQVSTIAGGYFGDRDGGAAQAAFRNPQALALAGQDIYISDTGNNAIRVLNLSANTVTTVAGGTAGYTDGALASARFNHPYGLAVSADGTKIYVADTGNNTIRLIDLNAGTVSTLAGGPTPGGTDGIGTAAQFDEPVGVALSSDGNTLYISDYLNHVIRALNLTTDAVTTLAGKTGVCGHADGVGTAAEMCTPGLLATDGHTLFWGDTAVGLLRCMNLTSLQVYTLAGTPAVLHMQNGTYQEVPGALTGPVQYNQVFGLAVAPDASFVLFADRTANVIRILH